MLYLSCFVVRYIFLLFNRWLARSKLMDLTLFMLKHSNTRLMYIFCYGDNFLLVHSRIIFIPKFVVLSQVFHVKWFRQISFKLAINSLLYPKIKISSIYNNKIIKFLSTNPLKYTHGFEKVFVYVWLFMNESYFIYHCFCACFNP